MAIKTAKNRQRGDKDFTEEWGLTKGDFEILVKCEDHTQEILEKMGTAMVKALIRIGMQAESFAKKNLTRNKSVDTGRLRNSITFKVEEGKNEVYIGTPVEYAAYVELGTGKHYKGGRQDPWVYQDDKGNWHMTHGQRAQPYLKPAAADHMQTFKNIIEDEMKNG